jgi:hypothetical protein
MSELTLFENTSIANSDLFKQLQQEDEAGKNLAGGAGGMRRISIRGGKFREIVGSEQVAVSKDDMLHCVIVNAAKVSRTYYAGTYDPANSAPPTCWSADTQTPAPDVPEEQRMSARCMDCKMNVKGSGQGDSRACRFSQRIAVVLEGQLDRVYQLQLPATSVFGESKDGKMPMQAYARFLQAHNTPAIAVLTAMYFDESSATPKLFFKPVRALTEEELKVVAPLGKHPDTVRAITMSVGKKNVESAPALASPKKEESPAPAAEAEPVKVVKKNSTPKPNDASLSDIVSNWQNEK